MLPASTRSQSPLERYNTTKGLHHSVHTKGRGGGGSAKSECRKINGSKQRLYRADRARSRGNDFRYDGIIAEDLGRKEVTQQVHSVSNHPPTKSATLSCTRSTVRSYSSISHHSKVRL
ncbi:hypothetical protein DPMN_078729 [Dreissena polymorpha]|uniref:Uncharacterized protein n=1 Tax=Dreissena polymorpha TaxID=45954 RepID=A0A9D3YMS8_DREPO|nr:hypothetical protein DPMN_078729 [Dreissena polymorpha]